MIPIVHFRHSYISNFATTCQQAAVRPSVHPSIRLSIYLSVCLDSFTICHPDTKLIE